MKNILFTTLLIVGFLQISCVDLVNSTLKEEALEKRRNDSLEKASEEESSIESIDYVSSEYVIDERKKENDDSIYKVSQFYHTGEKYAELLYRNDELDGLSTYFHKNGNLYVKVKYKNNKIEAILETKSCFGQDLNKGDFKNGSGKILFYNPVSDRIEREVNYKNYSKEGEFIAYYYTGEIKAKGKFVNDSINGPLEVLYKNGKKRESLFFKNGFLEGNQTGYFMDGSIKKLETWKQQRKISAKEYDKEKRLVSIYENDIEKKTSYHSNGSIHSKTTFKNGLKDGSFSYFHDNNKLKTIEIWKNDTLYSEKQWYDNGCIASISNFKNGNKDGLFKEYYSNGKVRVIQMYAHGQKNGPSTSYFPNGKVYAIGNYEYDKPKGKFHIYNDKGVFKGTKTYVE